MNKLFIVLSTLLAASMIVPSANAVGDSAISIQGQAESPRTGGIDGSVGPFQVGGGWVYTCAGCTFDITFSVIRVYGEATVNGDAEMLETGVTYTISDFVGSMILQRIPNTNTYEVVIDGHGTITTA